MIKVYIVTWILTLTQSVPCQPAFDDLGRPNTVIYSMLCFQTLSAPKVQEFTKKSDAISFYNRAKKEEYDIENDTASIRLWRDATILDVKIDSITKPIRYIGP